MKYKLEEKDNRGIMSKILIKEQRTMITVSYNKLSKLINKIKLREEADISSNVMAKFNKNKSG